MAPLFALENRLTEKDMVESAIQAYEEGNYPKCRSEFNSACSITKTPETKLLAKIYDGKITLDENPSSPSAATQVIDSFTLISDDVSRSKLKGLSDSYYSVLMQANAILGSWNEVQDLYKMIKNPDETCAYLNALSYYKLENYALAEQELVQYQYSSAKRSFETKELSLLYANILGLQKKYSASKDIYEKYYVLNQMEDENYLDYAKVLYNLRDYEKALQVSKLSKNPQVSYFSGLCYLNLSKWKEAYDSFGAYLSANGKKAEFSELSSFYKAYASYKMGKFKEAYSLFVDFANSTTQLNLARQSYELAARSAVLSQDYANAGKQAENLVRICFTDEEKQKAIIFCAQIYADNQNYSKAIATLEPYTNEKSSFALKCLFTMAEIYEKSFDTKKADEIYNQIITTYGNDPLAEEAQFRRGQLSYSVNDYSVAANRFSSYITKYTNGKHLEEAYYLCGECYLRCKEYDNSIRYSKLLVTKYPSSVYLYGANKNLFQAYYETGEYNQAQNSAKFLMNNFNSQAAQDGIPYQLKVLNSISEGKNKEVAEKYAEFEKLGGLSTKNGRLCGYELFDLYVKASDNESALNLAKDLKNVASKPDAAEFEGLGNVTVYIAQNSKWADRPSLYIKAAEYYKGCSKDANAASALYLAVEAFLELNQTGDARETAKTLKMLYPNSRQAQNVDSLFN